ncbi:hypothetical protein [Pseudomonas sp. BF-R-01]|jgi:hypothetical protein|uniref:hypothetical protein n=1 Tax=Pseudomonas sp. BF-R-01 TaxID=2832365 RepID=UPI000FBD6766|nr:hypothetical protein [Pseudomonas sp. BF-R-01]
MSVEIKQPRGLAHATSRIVLSADQPTGKAPMELFITDEHTEQYLSLQVGGGSDRGMLTGILGGICSSLCLVIGSWMALQGRWEAVIWPVVFGVPLFLAPFLWETLRPLPLPILFNRRTREVYFDHEGTLFHCPWDGIQAVAREFQIVGPYTAGMKNASLEIMVHRYQNPENALMVSLGSPAGKTLEMQKGFWEYIRSYMNNGPWFDKDGNHSNSDNFVKMQLSANIDQSQLLDHWRQTIAEKKAAADGENYLSGIDALMFLGHLMFYPSNLIQNLTYKIAKKRSRNRWPNIVLERLRHNGPATRLID